MTTPTSHGATEPHPVSEGLTDALVGGGQEAGPPLPRKLVLVLYSPLDTILPFHPLCPKSEHWGSGSNLPSQHACYFGRSEGT